jgi:hypothetical protein
MRRRLADAVAWVAPAALGVCVARGALVGLAAPALAAPAVDEPAMTEPVVTDRSVAGAPPAGAVRNPEYVNAEARVDDLAADLARKQAVADRHCNGGDEAAVRKVLSGAACGAATAATLKRSKDLRKAQDRLMGLEEWLAGGGATGPASADDLGGLVPRAQEAEGAACVGAAGAPTVDPCVCLRALLPKLELAVQERTGLVPNSDAWQRLGDEAVASAEGCGL